MRACLRSTLRFNMVRPDSLRPRLLSLIACCCGMAACAHAEEGNQIEMAEGLHADGSYSDVYLNDSFEAADAIAEARTLAGRGQWSEAARMLQQTSENAGDKLVRVAPGYYVGIRDHINMIIAGWPEAGINAYRALFEREMRESLSSPWVSRALHELLPLFDRYFCTAPAAELADTIGQLAIESGDLALAEYVYRRVLDNHPDGPGYAPRYEAMLRLIAAMRGEGEADRPGPESDAPAEQLPGSKTGMTATAPWNHSTISSACRAPMFFNFSRITMISRVVLPMAFSVSISLSRFGRWPCPSNSTRGRSS